MARVRARAVYLHGINTLYHALSVYTGMHKTLETLETLALRARVSKPVSAVLYIPVYTSTAWYNLYIYIYIYIYYVSYDRHLPRAHAYDLNSKAARGVYIERTSDVEVQRSQRSTWRSVATWTPSREEKQG